MWYRSSPQLRLPSSCSTLKSTSTCQPDNVPEPHDYSRRGSFHYEDSESRGRCPYEGKHWGVRLLLIQLTACPTPAQCPSPDGSNGHNSGRSAFEEAMKINNSWSRTGTWEGSRHSWWPRSHSPRGFGGPAWVPLAGSPAHSYTKRVFIMTSQLLLL